MDASVKERLIQFLEQFILPGRMEKFSMVLAERTRHLTIVLEDIFQSQNASAVLRSCECFGIQDVHIIENRNTFDINPEVVMGANKWLSLHQHNQLQENTEFCLLSLRKQGYRLIATSPLPGGIALEALPLQQKTALLFGNELTGLSAGALAMADDFMFIPMRGFTESLNISVSAAICLHHLTQSLRSTRAPWQLSHEEQLDLQLDWMQKTLKNPQALINYFMKKELSV